MSEPTHISDSARKFFDEHIIVIPVTVPPRKVNIRKPDGEIVEVDANTLPRPFDQIGIPYAQQGIFHGRLYQQCPVCDVRVFEDTDEQGERESNNYAKHYEEEHT